ncbi:ParA family protein [Chitinophaga sp. CC14]|uniref:AAA family ATPase n=1 Tax=Chitinophaga sp. CC14 TaxID=3029199 RepID=UPI003B77F36B
MTQETNEIVELIGEIKNDEADRMPPELPDKATLIDSLRSLKELYKRAVIICSVSLKGGTGKSLTAAALANFLTHLGFKPLLIDCDDENMSCLNWSASRTKYKDLLSSEMGADQIAELENLFPDTAVMGMPLLDALASNVKKYAVDYDFILIDSRPSLSAATSKIMLLSDYAIVPVQTGKEELRNVHKFLGHYENAVMLRGEDRPLPGALFVNRDNPRTKLSKMTKKKLLEAPIELMYYHLSGKEIFKEAFGDGIGLCEIVECYGETKTKADELRGPQKEYETLATELLNHMVINLM